MKPACNHRQSLLMDIQKVDFMLVDLNLFLDTHPNCADAIAEHNRLAGISCKLRDAYEKQYGPLMARTWDQSECNWAWVENPWPWDAQ